MNEKKKENLGIEVHDRILGSITKDRKRKAKKKLTFASVVFGILLCGIIFLSKSDQLEKLFLKKQGRELTADFLNGTLKEERENGSKIDSLHIGKDQSEAIFLDEDQKKMVMNIAKMNLADDDVLNIKTGIGGFYKVVLPDGSIVNLNANSNLHYAASYLRDRKLTLSGEAFFEVKKLIKDNKKVPFEVKTDQQKIQVLGTQFNVRTTGQFDETLLYEGSLDVKEVKSGKSTILIPGDLIRINQNGSTFRKLHEGEMEELLAWKEGFLYYENRSLAHILSDLQKYYDFDYDKNLVPQESFTIYLARENNLNELIALLNSSSFTGIKLVDKSLVFSK